MKNFLIFLFILSGTMAAAQSSSRLPQLDKSPMDMSYYPVNYPVSKIQPNKTLEPLIARVVYSRPQKMGRKVFEELVEKGKIWRLGANEATEIEFFRDVRIDDKKIKKGRYTLYAIERDNDWTVILNSELDVWGAFKYDANKDIVRMNCPITKITEPVEAFTMVFEKVTDKSIKLVMAWDDQLVSLPVSW